MKTRITRRRLVAGAVGCGAGVLVLPGISPFYVIVDGRPIRSPEDARYFHDHFSTFAERVLPRVKNEQIRRVLEAKCRDALAKYAAQAEITQ